jgi:hypothetical protein
VKQKRPRPVEDGRVTLACRRYRPSGTRTSSAE